MSTSKSENLFLVLTLPEEIVSLLAGKPAHQALQEGLINDFIVKTEEMHGRTFLGLVGTRGGHSLMFRRNKYETNSGADSVNKFRFAFDNAPKSATHFDGHSYSTLDNDTGVYTQSLSVPDCQFIEGLYFHPTPMQVIEGIANELES